MHARPPVRLSPDILPQRTQHGVDEVVEKADHLVQEPRRLALPPPRCWRPVDLCELKKVVKLRGDDGGDLVLCEGEGGGKGREGEEADGAAALRGAAKREGSNFSASNQRRKRGEYERRTEGS